MTCSYYNVKPTAHAKSSHWHLKIPQDLTLRACEWPSHKLWNCMVGFRSKMWLDPAIFWQFIERYCAQWKIEGNRAIKKDFIYWIRRVQQRLEITTDEANIMSLHSWGEKEHRKFLLTRIFLFPNDTDRESIKWGGERRLVGKEMADPSDICWTTENMQ